MHNKVVSNYRQLINIKFGKPLTPDSKTRSYYFNVVEILDYQGKTIFANYEITIPENLIQFKKLDKYYRMFVIYPALEKLNNKMDAEGIHEIYVYPKEKHSL